MNVERLNEDYGITGQLEFIPGIANLPCVVIQNRRAKSLISLYGAQVLSFQPKGEADDLLFVSENAYYQTGKAFRGGIPVCWPWFGPYPGNLQRPNHGFVRTHPWTVAGTATANEDETKLQLSFPLTPEIKALWPYDFELTLDITVGKELTLDLVTRNNADQPFAVTQAFHPYFRIGDIDQVRISGLEEKPYIDRLADDMEKIQSGPIRFTEEVDRIYTGVRHDPIIEDAALHRRIRIASNTQNTVVWNPWVKTSAKMPDLKPGDYQRFVCVEPGHVASGAITIQPGDTSRLRASFASQRG